MDTTIQTNGPAENVSYTLPAAITIETIESVASGIHALSLSPASHLTLNAADTETLTTPGAQLLLALDKTLSQGGGRLFLLHAKEPVKETLRTLGLEAQLTTWSNGNG